MSITAPTEPQRTVELMSEQGRQKVASRLRHLAQVIADGQVTLDNYDLEPEWHATPPSRTGVKGCSPTGRMFLTLGYWNKPIAELPE